MSSLTQYKYMDFQSSQGIVDAIERQGTLHKRIADRSVRRAKLRHV